MTHSTKLVLCSHCAARLRLRADSTRAQFRCAKCGELTATDLGASLAGNAPTPAGEPARVKRSNAALVSCPVCSRKVSSRAPTCPGCGEPILRQSKVVVYGYTQQFLVNPKVRVYWNGEPIGSVKKGDRISFDIKSSGQVSFRASGRESSIRVQAGSVTNIKISWDRITGKMVPQIVDSVTPGA